MVLTIAAFKNLSFASLERTPLISKNFAADFQWINMANWLNSNWNPIIEIPVTTKRGPA